MIYLITNQQSAFTPIGYSMSTVEDCIKYFENHEEVELDTETEGFDPYTKAIISLQLGDGKNQYVIDAKTVNILAFKKLIESKVILMQNAKFDLRFLYFHGIIPSKIYDTFLGETVLYNGITGTRRALDYLVYKYCKQELDKTIRGNIHREGLSTRVIKYAADDVKYLGEIKRKQLILAEKKGLTKTIALDNEYVRVLAYIEYCGVKLDTEKWKKKCQEDIVAREKLKQELDEFILNRPDEFPEFIDNQLDLFQEGVSAKINWSSSHQVIPLMKKLGVNTQIKDKVSGLMKDSLDKKVLRPQIDVHPLVGLYIKYGEAEKLVSTYGDNWFGYINKVTGRIHTNYTQIMNTGRLSSGQKGKPKKGIPQKPNMQNVPADDRTRSCFIADKSNILIVSDYSGQEQVVLANKSLEPNILDFYNKGFGDMHSYNAKLVFKEELKDIPLEEVKSKRPDLRQLAKAAGFAINYGGVGFTIANNLSISAEEGERVYKAYFEAFPDLDKYFKEQKKKALHYGYIEFNEVSKRKCFFYGFDEFVQLHKELYETEGFWETYKTEKNLNTPYFNNVLKPKVREYFIKKGNMERDALNYPIQGTSADMTKLAGIYMFRYLEDNNLLFKVKMPNVVHDELHLECPEDMANDLSFILKDCMERAGRVFCKTIPVKADPCITPYWTH
jgi:DNA polymerase I-like protein with 3'-5' exonuclease and polymerase domains